MWGAVVWMKDEDVNEKTFKFRPQLSLQSVHSQPHPPTHPHTPHAMGRKRDQPAAHRHGLAEDMANPWKNGIRVSVGKKRIAWRLAGRVACTRGCCERRPHTRAAARWYG